MWPAQEHLSLISTGAIPEIKDKLAALPKGAVLYCVHSGSSMDPTLIPLDLLEIVPCEESKLEVGDVIFFQANGRDLAVVHRISRINQQEGITTRGDNNTFDDSWILQTSAILGRVVAAWSGHKRRKIAGGKFGRLAYLLSWNRRIISRILSNTLGPLYCFLSLQGIIQSVLPNSLKPRVVVFQINGKNQLKLMMNCRQVGYYDKQQKKWHIRRPFRLFVDNYTLTTPNQLNFE